jgi:hypothetical protein
MANEGISATARAIRSLRIRPSLECLSGHKTPRVAKPCETSRSLDYFDMAFTQNDTRRACNTTKFKSSRSVEIMRSESGCGRELKYQC